MPKGKYTRPVRPAITPIGPSIAYLQLTRGQFACIDAEDAPWLSLHNWSAKSRGRGEFYARRYHDGGDLALHDAIMKPSAGFTVDHRFQNTLDHRKAAMRLATSVEQSSNRRMPSHNSTGYKGVSWVPKRKAYRVQITYRGVHYWLGFVDDPAYGAELYRQKAIELHGEFVCFKPPIQESPTATGECPSRRSI